MAYLSLAALQLELCVEDNLSLLEKEIALVRKRFPWVQMVVLPELCTFGPGTDLAVPVPGAGQRAVPDPGEHFRTARAGHLQHRPGDQSQG